MLQPADALPDPDPDANPAPGPGPARARLGVLRRTAREAGLALVVLGVAILLFVVYQLFGTALTEEHDQRTLAKSFAQALAHNDHLARPAPRDGSTLVVPGARDLSPSTPTGVAVDHLVIPAIHLDKFVVQGTAEADLMEGPGHYVNTPMPGEQGNVAIAGHRTTYGAPFFELGHLKPGNAIYITDTAGRTFDYRVEREDVVPPSDVAVLDDTPDAQLTLTTCNPPYSATSRLVLVARLVGRPVSAAPATPAKPAGKAPAQPARTKPAKTKAAKTKAAKTKPAKAQANNLGQGDSSAWPPALAYGAAVAVLWALTRVAIARTRRWRRLGAFVVGVAICAVPLWFCFENAVRLLPPNI